MATKKKTKTTQPKNSEEMFQRAFDIQKHYDSEQERIDTCGTYQFCGECNKNLDYPCAKAHTAYNKIKKATQIVE